MFNRARFSWSTILPPVILSLVIVIAICSALYLREADQIASAALDNESHRMERFAGLYGSDIAGTVSDLRLLVSGDGFQDYLNTGNPADLARAQRRAIFFAKENPDYDQIRYIDENGQERFRLNHDGGIVPPEQLQNKADRPYFQKTLHLAPGQIYISAVDLNTEKGAIEQPIKPTVRIAMPVFDPSGNRKGIYIINFLAANSIERLRDFVPRYAQRFRLLNAQGYWLAGRRPEEEWGFILPGRSAMTLAKSNPQLWAKITHDEVGQDPLGGGYFTWRRVAPRDFVQGKPVTLVADDDYLVFASEISADEWAASFARLRQTFVIVGVLMMILATIITWFFNARRRAQQERDRFFDLTRDLLCVAGFDGRFKRLNPTWERVTGYTREELLSAPFLDFVHPDDREKTLAETAVLTEGGETSSFENRYRCRDGSYRWLLWNARSVVDDGLIYASARDLTERKQIEESLRQSEERIRLMVESVKDYAILMLDPAGRVMTWNPAAERLHGYGAAEVIGRHFSLFHPEERARDGFANRALQEAAEKGRIEDEGLRVRKDGSTFWANVVITAVRNAQGESLGFVKVTRDITIRKEAAARIQNLNAELLRRAELLEIANKELESFSYSVSHDLRAPLRHIHGFVELLQKSPALQKDDANRRYMEIIARAAKEMGRLIDDLLAFSRTGRTDMHPTLVNMREMVDQVIRDRQTDYKDRTVIWQIKPLSPVPCDANLLRLVWMNLIDNALKYTRPREKAVIEIGQLNGNEANGDRSTVTYYVRDNGVGFDMHYASKLFGVFQRLHRAEDFEGTGIGLANVQRIVHRHGGRVWGESRVDSGATFFFSLPTNVPPTD